MRDIGLAAKSVKISDPLEEYACVIVKPDETSETQYTAGNATSGKTLTVIIPFGDTKIAQKILRDLDGFRYQPISATGAIIDPATELGDKIAVAGASSLMASQNMTFSNLLVADISAPGEEEIDHEIEYIPHEKRRINRAIGGISGEIQKTNGKILEDRKELIAALNGEDGAPEDLASGLKSYVRYDLENSEAYAESVLFSQIGEKARAEIGVYAVMGEDGIPRTFAEILADQINLESAVDDAFAEIELKADSSTVTALDGRVTKTETAQTDLTSRVGDAEAALKLKADSETVDALDGKVTKIEKAQADITTRVGNAESALSQKADSETVTDLSGRVKKTEEAQIDLTTRVGDVESGLSSKVSNTALTETLKNYALTSALKSYLTTTAAAELYVTDDDVASIIGAYIVTDANGNKASLAAILADIIKLQGDTEILGNLSISDGRLRVEKSIITPSTVFANKFSSNDSEMLIGGHRLNIGSDFSADGNGVAFGAKKYTPTQITSTTGTVLVLGIA